MKTPSETDVAIMGALELLFDVAYHDGTHGDRDLAVVAEAWELAGYSPSSAGDGISHGGGHSEILARIFTARIGRHRRLLRADARGLLYGLRVLADAGILTHLNASEAARQRWLRRGGHDRSD